MGLQLNFRLYWMFSFSFPAAAAPIKEHSELRGIPQRNTGWGGCACAICTPRACARWQNLHAQRSQVWIQENWPQFAKFVTLSLYLAAVQTLQLLLSNSEKQLTTNLATFSAAPGDFWWLGCESTYRSSYLLTNSAATPAPPMPPFYYPSSHFSL